jgi:hypothetical protein
MSSGSCLTSKLYDKIIKVPSKSHEAIPLNPIKTSAIRQNDTVALVLYNDDLKFCRMATVIC